MDLLVVAFVAGVLTVLAPCILPLLPVIVGGSLSEHKNWRRPFVITASLAISLIIFTLLLKTTTAFLGVPLWFWQMLAGGLVIILGIFLVFPGLWEPLGARLSLGSNRLLGKAGRKQGIWGEVLTGAALGPVFSSCSPTYAFILANVLPVTPAIAITYLLAYVLGLSLILLLVALIGQQLISKLQWASNPQGWFKRGVGIVFIVVGLGVATGFDRALQAYVINQGWYDAIGNFERSLLR